MNPLYIRTGLGEVPQRDAEGQKDGERGKPQRKLLLFQILPNQSAYKGMATRFFSIDVLYSVVT